MDSAFRTRRHHALRILCLLPQGAIKNAESNFEENCNELSKDVLHLRLDRDSCWKPDLLHYSKCVTSSYIQIGSTCENLRDWIFFILSHPKLFCHGHNTTNQGLPSFGPIRVSVHRDCTLDNMRLDLDRVSRRWQREPGVMDLPGGNTFHLAGRFYLRLAQR